MGPARRTPPKMGKKNLSGTAGASLQISANVLPVLLAILVSRYP